MKLANGYRRKWHLKIFLFFSGGHLVYQSGTILAILVGSHQGNISVKFESYWPKNIFLFFSSGGHFVYRSEIV